MGDNRIFALPAAPILPVEKMYEVVPIGEARSLTTAEQIFISQFVKGNDSLIQKAIDHGLPAKSLKVEFTFENGHRGGLLFSRK